ncbi:MAG: NAD(P)/FAD-dependent oxidoreductase [Candidatus Altiarchaeota archaeon]
MVKKHDVVIVGAGPAGLFTALELAGSKLKVLVVEKGKDIKSRPRDEVMCGVGGAGGYSDGTLNLSPYIGGNLDEVTGDAAKSRELVERVDEVFLGFGAPKRRYGLDKEKAAELEKRSAAAGITFINIVQQHIGSENTPKVIASFEKHLMCKGIEFLTETEVADLIVDDGRCRGVVLACGSRIEAECVVLAPGRVGAGWVDGLIKKHEIDFLYGPIDVGVRVEVPAIVMEDVTSVSRDPKFHIKSRTYDDFVRTFCTNHKGFIVKEKYDGFIGVNGYARHDKRSENTNFAFLVRINLTEPVEDTIDYGQSIAHLATTMGGGKPIIQRAGDLRRGRRSHPDSIASNPVHPTLKETTPGDISMALPGRIVTDILEGLDALDKVIPGVAADSTLLYAPEIKYYALRITVDEHMESSMPGLFAAGDGVGLSRDIVNASATGILAGDGVAAKLK